MDRGGLRLVESAVVKRRTKHEQDSRDVPKPSSEKKLAKLSSPLRAFFGSSKPAQSSFAGLLSEQKYTKMLGSCLLVAVYRECKGKKDE